MTQRRLAKREVTDVTIPQDNTAQGVNSLADTAMGFVDLQKKKDLANMNDFMADAQLQMLDVTNKWRIENETDPTNQEATTKLHANYDKILGQYNNKVGLLSRGDWIQATNKIKNQYQLDNLQWGQKQTVVNMENRTNDSIDKNLQMFRNLGKTFDVNKLKNSYQTSREALENFVVGTVGKAQSDKWLKDYHKDSMKMFVYGAAESDPVKAEMLLNQQDIQNDIDSPEDMQTLRSIVEKNKKLKEEGVVSAQNTTEDKMLTDYLLDSSKVDIMTVDRALEDKQIRPEFAQSIRNAILSPKTVGAVSKDDAYIEFTNKFADIGKRGDRASLEEMLQFRNDIINAHSQGRLDASDTQKFLKDGQEAVNKRLNTAADTVLNKTNPKSFLQAITFWTDEYADKKPEVKARMYRSMMDKIRGGQNPHEAINDVIKEEVNRASPNTVLSGGTPNNIISSSGGIKQGIYPGPTDAKAGYSIKDGQVVAKGSSSTSPTAPIKKYRVGDKLSIKGNIYVVTGFDKDGEAQVEKANAKAK
jgi:hypothetical protein